MPKPDWVEMKHPDFPDADPGRVSRQSFELTHKALGWKLAKPDKKPTRKDTD